MSSSYKKIQKNAQQFEMNKIYQNMTPEQYREGVRRAVKLATEDMAKEYDRQLERLQNDYKQVLRDSVSLAIDTFSIEILYELGNILECYVDEPDHLDQKIDIVQNLYQTAMNNIEKYTTYKNDKQARKAFDKKRKTVEKIFGIIRN